MNPKEVVVIGAGVGGAAVAALLRRGGHGVTLLERNDFCGGKCSGFERDGFLVDSGIHMFSMGDRGPLGEVGRSVGADLRWSRKNPGSTLYQEGRYLLHQYQAPTDPRMMAQVLRLRARQRLGMEGFAGSRGRGPAKPGKRATSSLFRATREGGVTGLVRAARRIASLDESFISGLDGVSTVDFLDTFTEDRLVHQFFGACSMILLVVPYTRSSAGELMWCVVSMYRNANISFPRGGSGEVPGSLIGAFLRDGGRLELETGAREITVEGGRVKGVVTGDGREIAADVVVSNAGIKRSIEMAGEESFPAGYVARARGLEESCSWMTARYGLARCALELRSPCFLGVPDTEPEEMFEYIDRGGVPEDPYLFVTVPTMWHPRAAPLGKQQVVMGVPGPATVTEETVEQSERILDSGEKKLFSIFPQLEKDVEWRTRTHGLNTSRITGKPTGECIGLAQCVGQTGLSKPGVRTPVEGLFLVGCDAGARGVGTEQAAASALYVAALIDHQRKPGSTRWPAGSV